jgi:hypothetical protein
MSRNKLPKTFLLVFVALISVIGHGQTPQLTIDEILNNASKQATNYSEAFRNLLAEENKVFETFDKNGNKKIKRTVGSTFIVYGLQTAENQIVEFRNVTSVDGKPIGNVEDRAQAFFEKISAAGDSLTESRRLADESLRYDHEVRLIGLTLFQAVPLYPKVRPALEFTRLPDELIGGRTVIVLAYKQVKQSPAIQIIDESSKGSGNAAISFSLDLKIEPAGTELLQGTFWIDSETFQTRKEIRELSAQPANFPSRVVISKTEFIYADSGFDILTPATIVYTDYNLDKKKQLATPDLRVTFTYSKFSRADVEVRSAEIK